MANKNTSQLWMVPFADLMSVLTILFLALFVFSYSKDSTYQKAMAELQKELGNEDARKKLTETEMAEKVQEKLKEEIKLGHLGMEVTLEKVKLTFAAPVLFDSGSIKLKPQALNMLKKVSEGLQTLDNPVIVEGHTDNKRIIGGRFKTNRELSAARAFSVIEFFMKQGLPPQRFTAYGCGEFRPIAPNDTEENRSRNRRIEITVMRQRQET